MIIDMNEDFLIRLNYVETSEPDRVAKELQKQDQRIEELEKENEEKEDKILDLKSYNSDLKETISKLSFSAVRCQAINDEVCQYILDNELLKKENDELKEKLKNAIVPKFRVGDEVWLIEENGLTDKKELMNCKIQRHSIEYKVDGIFSRTWYYDDSLFATKEEAQKKLEELR